MNRSRKYITIALCVITLTACGNSAKKVGDTNLDSAVVAEQAETVAEGGVAGVAADGAIVAKAAVENIEEGDVVTDLVKNGKPSIIDFNATWCKPCKMMTPIFHKLAAEMGKKYNFISIDIDKRPDLAAKYNVQAVPTFVFLDSEGVEGYRITGAVSEATLREELEHPTWQ